MTSEEKIEKAVKLIEMYSECDGSHHKTWVFDQVIRALKDDEYNKWLKKMNATEGFFNWDHGTPP